MANTVDKVLAIAKEEVGYLEKKNGDLNSLFSKTANAGTANYTKYGYEMHQIYPTVMDYPASWCDAFVDWCFYKAYGVANAKGLLGGNFDDYTVASAQLYKNKNAYYKTDPKPGDQIFFNNGTRICHTGLVYKVDANRVYTIEGNTSGGSSLISNGGGVAMKSYIKTYARIDGYGRPKYDTATVIENTTTVTPTSTVTYAAPSGTLKIGSKGDSVKQLQECLNKVINAGIKVDGDFGNATKTALINFQKKYGLAADGIYGPASRTKLVDALKGTAVVTPAPVKKNIPALAVGVLKKGSKGAQVKNLQLDLNYVIGASLAADGIFGAGTETAVKNFQKKYGLTADGIYGAKSALKMASLLK